MKNKFFSILVSVFVCTLIVAATCLCMTASAATTDRSVFIVAPVEDYSTQDGVSTRDEVAIDETTPSQAEPTEETVTETNSNEGKDNSSTAPDTKDIMGSVVLVTTIFLFGIFSSVALKSHKITR